VSEKSSIAVIDDDQGIRDAVEDLVQSCGYQSVAFASAEEFLGYEDRRNFNCILLDVKMPGLTGIELQSALNLEANRPPIIFMTSYRDEKTRASAMAGGAYAFLTKPVQVNQLIGYLRDAVRS
jgi:FixJ family two-component response regulator